MGLLDSLLSFAVVAGVLTVTPGLDTALVLRTAATQGRAPALGAGAGVCAGILGWALAAAVGVAALLAASPGAYRVLTLLGAGYMLWLGGRMLWTALRVPRASRTPRAPGRRDDPLPGSSDGAGDAAGPVAAFRAGFLVNVLNPKVGAFYVAMLPQFLGPDLPPVLMGPALGLVHAAESFVWFAALVLLVDRLGALVRRPAAQRWIDAVAGAVIVAFGLGLALSYP